MSTGCMNKRKSKFKAVISTSWSFSSVWNTHTYICRDSAYNPIIIKIPHIAVIETQTMIDIYYHYAAKFEENLNLLSKDYNTRKLDL